MSEKKVMFKLPFKHEEDQLDLVLAEWKGEYVVWTYNRQYSGYSNGKYFTSLPEALQQFGEDAVKYCKK